MLTHARLKCVAAPVLQASGSFDLKNPYYRCAGLVSTSIVRKNNAVLPIESKFMSEKTFIQEAGQTNVDADDRLRCTVQCVLCGVWMQLRTYTTGMACFWCRQLNPQPAVAVAASEHQQQWTAEEEQLYYGLV